MTRAAMHGSLCRSMGEHASGVRVTNARYQEKEAWLEGQKCKGDHLS